MTQGERIEIENELETKSLNEEEMEPMSIEVHPKQIYSPFLNLKLSQIHFCYALDSDSPICRTRPIASTFKFHLLAPDHDHPFPPSSPFEKVNKTKIQEYLQVICQMRNPNGGKFQYVPCFTNPFPTNTSIQNCSSPLRTLQSLQRRKIHS